MLQRAYGRSPDRGTGGPDRPLLVRGVSRDSAPRKRRTAIEESDGNIDYSAYSLSELREVEASINRQAYPKNYENLMRAIEACPADEEASEKQEIVDGAITAATVVCGLIALLNGIMLIQGISALFVVNLLVFGACTYFVARGSILAASSALMLYVVNYLLLFLDQGVPGGVIPLVVGAVLLTGVLATLARRDKSPPTEIG